MQMKKWQRRPQKERTSNNKDEEMKDVDENVADNLSEGEGEVLVAEGEEIEMSKTIQEK